MSDLPPLPDASNRPDPTGSTGDGWVDLCSLQDVPGQGAQYVAVENRGLAVMRTLDDQVRVVDNACPHAGGSLSGGYVEVVEGKACAICPWHGWPFDLETGACVDNPAYRVKCYPVRVDGGRVWVRISPDRAHGP